MLSPPDALDPDAPFPDIRKAFLENPLSLAGMTPGVWPVHKPRGMTSHDAVRAMRKRLGMQRVGHAGTLDPMAEGLLLVMTGRATRLFDDIQNFHKSYRAGFRLGERTDSRDVTGEPLADWRPVRVPPLSREDILDALTCFTGEIDQIPPMHSALKRNGTPLYKLARKGIEVERQARRTTVYELVLEEFDGAAGELRVTASSGFYVRTMIDDLGLRLEAGAIMTSLVRTAIGPFSLAGALVLDEKPVPGVRTPESG